MRVWVATIGEPVPVNESFSDRLHRVGQLVHFLAEKGHQVTWWTSAFDHFTKKHHFSQDTVLNPSQNLEIRLLHGCGYSRNISVARIRDQREIARKYALQAEELDVPDVIVSALPVIELCDESVKYGKKHNVPVVLDMRDMWPDIFVDAVPSFAKPVARILLRPMLRQAEKACAGADAIIGVTDDFVDWGIAKAKRQRKHTDKAFPFAYPTADIDPSQMEKAKQYWDSWGVGTDADEFVVCFFGTIGHQLDIDTVVNAAKILQRTKPQAKLVLCGTGDRLEHYKEQAATFDNVLLPGWVNAAQIRELMSRSSLGLDPMPESYDFLSSINNKALEYISAGLPVVSSPKRGVLYTLLKDNDCGASHETGNADELAEIISTLADNPQRLQELSANASKLFESAFTVEIVNGSIMEYLQQISGKV